MKMRSIQKILLVFTVIASSLVSFTSCTNECEKKEQAIRFVKVEKVSPAFAANNLSFNGNIKERSTTEVSFRVGGPLEKLNVEIGTFVKKGQTIAVIDQRDYHLQLQTAKAQFMQAKGEYERYNELYKKKKLPENTLDKLEAAHLMTKAAFENAENALEDTELKAPISGYIYEKHTENFQTVGPGQPIVSIVDMSKQEVVIHVPASKLNEIHKDRSVYCTVQNAGVSDLSAELTNIAKKAGPDKLYEVRFQLILANDTKVRPGMSAELKVNGFDDEDKKMTIPVGSVFHDNGTDYVWIFNTTTSAVEKRKISINKLENKGRITIQTGINTGEQIVTAGVHSLVDKQKVKAIQEQSKSNSGGLL